MINVGIIGCGRIAKIHWLALRTLPQVQINGVMSRRPGAAEKFAKTHGIPNHFSSIEDICSDDKIDAIHICSENTAHLDAVICSLQHKKHIVCEKPLGVTVQETEKMVSLAQNTPVLATSCFSYQLHPSIELINTHLPEIGALKTISMKYLQCSYLSKSKNGWLPEENRYGPSYIIADIGSHCFNVLNTILKTNLSIKSAKITNITGINKCSDIASEIHASAENKCPEITINISKISEGITNQISVEFQGSTGAIIVNNILEEEIIIKRNNNEEYIIQRSPDNTSCDTFQFPAGHPQGWLSGFVNLFSRFYNGISSENYDERDLGIPSVKDAHEICKLVHQTLELGAKSV